MKTKQKIKLMHFFRYGSVLLALLLVISGCAKVEYIHRADWIYVNNSSSNLKLLGGVKMESTGCPPLDITLNKGESYKYEFKTHGGDESSIKDFPCPFDDNPYYIEKNVQIIVNNKDTIQLKDLELSIRNRNNYELKKISDKHYSFTYTFTDTILQNLMKKNN